MPICWEPRSRRSQQVRNRKVRLLLQGYPTTHWASLGYQHDLTLGRKSYTTGGKDSVYPDRIQLPFTVTSIPSYAVLPHAIAEIGGHEVVASLCDRLEALDDLNNTVAAQLQSLIRPDVLAVL